MTGSGYIVEAAELRPPSPLPWIGGALGMATGAWRGRRTFARACRRNLARIDALPDPRVWQFYRPGFFVALGVMIAGGAVLRLIAERGGFWALVLVGSLELIIGTALLTSSREFFRRRDSEARPNLPERGAGAV